MAEIYYNILDTNVLRSFSQATIDAPDGITKALDTLFARGRLVVITQEVLDEAVNPNSATYKAFIAWYKDNKATRIVTVITVTRAITP